MAIYFILCLSEKLVRALNCHNYHFVTMRLASLVFFAFLLSTRVKLDYILYTHGKFYTFREGKFLSSDVCKARDFLLPPPFPRREVFALFSF